MADIEEGLDSSRFDATIEALRDLVEMPKEDGATALRDEWGGVAGVARRLGVDLQRGLDQANQADLDARRAYFGSNFVPPQKQKGLLMLMWEALHDLTLVILLIAGVISLILGVTVGEHPDVDWIEGAAILVAVAVVTIVAAVNDYQKETQFRKLNAVKEDELIKAIRNDEPVEISTHDVMVGDIVRIETGDILTADGVIFEDSDVRMDEAAMTGESDLMKKKEGESPFLFSGTTVMEGKAKMLVVAVGLNSQAGIIKGLILGLRDKAKEDERKATKGSKTHKKGVAVASNDEAMEMQDLAVRLQEESTSLDGPSGAAGSSDDLSASLVANEEKNENVTDLSDSGDNKSVLQGKLEKLAVQIGYAGLAVAVIAFIVMVIRFSVETFAVDGESWQKSYINDYLRFFIVGITILVVAIPEGLPLAVTLSLAFSVKKMLIDNNLVRHLNACETMGNATTICSDKTGTLTTNRMTVMQCWIEGHTYTLAKDAFTNIDSTTKELFGDAVAVNSTSEILPARTAGGLPEHTGNKTECALLTYTGDFGGFPYRPIRDRVKTLRLNTFSSARKRMSVLVRDPNRPGKVSLYVKGASEIILGLCTTTIGEKGVVRPFSDEEKSNVNSSVINKFAEDALRTLCLAYREYDDDLDFEKMTPEQLESDLTCMCIVGIEDPVRPEVPEAIAACQRAGIVVRMVTGDNVVTARAISIKCGLYNPHGNHIVMEGPEFRRRVLDANGNLRQDEFDKIWEDLRVLARSSPRDKFTLVSGLIASKLHRNRQVVAVTGDGTNDGPALKRADVGFAMNSGTPVAKEASDIILMDDNFESIVKAVKWGRNVYDSIAKFLQFQLTVNLVAILVAMIGAVAISESPITAVQLLWINLIMDSFASLALATEPPSDQLLKRKPYGRNKALVSRRMMRMIVGVGLFQLIVMLVLVFAGDKIFNVPSGRNQDGGEDPSVHYTIVFTAFVIMTIFNQINARKIHDELNVFENFFNNWIFVGILVGEFVAQILLTEFGNRPFHCNSNGLNGIQWLVCIVLGFLQLVIGFLLRLMPKAWIPLRARFGSEPVDEPPVSRGRALWVRGLRRLRTQLLVVRNLNEQLVFKRRRTSVMLLDGTRVNVNESLL